MRRSSFVSLAGDLGQPNDLITAGLTPRASDDSIWEGVQIQSFTMWG